MQYGTLRLKPSDGSCAHDFLLSFVIISTMQSPWALCNKISESHQFFVLFIALKYSFYIACIIQSTEDWPGDRQNYYKEQRICLPTTRHGEYLCVSQTSGNNFYVVLGILLSGWFFFSIPPTCTYYCHHPLLLRTLYHIVQIIFIVHLVHTTHLRSVQSVKEKILPTLRISSQYSVSFGR